MGLTSRLIFGLVLIWSHSADGSTIWLGQAMVQVMCKYRSAVKSSGYVPVTIKDGRQNRERKTECDWVSWPRCANPESCHTLRKNTCGRRHDAAGNAGSNLTQSSALVVEYEIPKFDRDDHKLKDYDVINIDHGNAVKGQMSLKNGVIEGFKYFTNKFSYFPLNLSMVGEAFFPKFKLKGDYKWNLIFFYIQDGEAQTLGGEGHLDITITNLRMNNMTARFTYSPELKTYQLENFDAVNTITDGWSGEISGATLDGAPADISKVFYAQARSGSHFIPELLRQLININAPRDLPRKQLDMFFTAFMES